MHDKAAINLALMFLAGTAVGHLEGQERSKYLCRIQRCIER